MALLIKQCSKFESATQRGTDSDSIIVNEDVSTHISIVIFFLNSTAAWSVLSEITTAAAKGYFQLKFPLLFLFSKI